MKGIWLENGELQLRDDLSQPALVPGEAVIRPLLAGICNTDLELVRGYYPYQGIPGHEFVGRVEEGPEEWLGKRVVGEINAVCGVCSDCGAGRTSHCANRTVLGITGRHGAFAEFLTLPIANLHRVPENVPNDRAVFCEPLAAALEIQEQVRIGRNDRVLVVGDGKLGLLIAQTLGLTGCRLTLVGRHPEKLAIAANRGLKTALETEIGGSESDVSGNYDIAVECTGASGGFGLARRALRPRGTLVLKSTYAGELIVDASSLVVDEITVVGSRCGPFAPALELLASEAVDVGSLVDQSYHLTQGLKAFEHAARQGALKILLDY